MSKRQDKFSYSKLPSNNNEKRKNSRAMVIVVVEEFIALGLNLDDIRSVYMSDSCKGKGLLKCKLTWVYPVILRLSWLMKVIRRGGSLIMMIYSN